MLDVVMPVYNEEGCIREVVARLHEIVLGRIPGARLLAVDDGSRDGTPAILDGLAASLEGVEVLHKPNGGHGDAVLHGLRRTRAEWLFLIDSDNQFEIQDFWKLWEVRESADLLMGVRVARHDPWLRLVITRLLRFGLRLLFHVRLRDANVPFKLMRREVWEGVVPLLPETVRTPSIFIAVAAARQGRRIVEMPVAHYERRTGTVSIRKWKLLKFCWRSFGELLAFRRRLIKEQSCPPPGRRS